MTEDEQFEMVLATRAIIAWPESVFMPYHENSKTPWEINQWLEVHVGKEKIDWAIEYTGLGTKYKFRDPDHKTLFAITWL